MKVWLVQTGEDVPFEKNLRKLRTAVLAEELVSRGHEVVWWAASFSHLHKEWVTGDRSTTLSSGVKVEFLRGTGYQGNVSVARIVDHRVVARDFRKRSGELSSPDIILCGLPPYDLAYQVARYAKRHHIPFIVDARDYWPDIFLSVVPSFFQPLARLGLASEFRLARYAFRSADRVVAMSQDVLDWALSYCNRDQRDDDKVFHLGFSSPPAREIPPPDWLQKINDKFIVAFVGTFSRYHGPAVLINVAKRLLEAGRNDIAIVIAGSGGDHYGQIVAAANGLPNVVLPGWLKQDAISVLLDSAAVGVCPTNIRAKFFPNKTFLYFSRGLPVLSAFRGELRELLTSDGLGGYYPPEDDRELTSRIIKLCDDKSLYRNTCERVRLAFAENFDESVIYPAFADYLEKHAVPGTGTPAAS